MCYELGHAVWTKNATNKREEQTWTTVIQHKKKEAKLPAIKRTATEGKVGRLATYMVKKK